MTSLRKEIATYKGRLFTVVEQTHEFNGKEKIFEQVRRAPGCRLIVRNDKDEFLITREFRHELNGYDYRLPGGKVFDTLAAFEAALASGEDMEACAKRAATIEGAEEAAITVLDLDLVDISKCGATITWDLYYFAVTKWQPRAEGQHLEAGENINITWMTPDAVRLACLNGQLSEERSAIQLLRLLQKEA